MHYDAPHPGKEVSIAAVAAGDVAHDREPEAGAGCLRIELVETLEYGFFLTERYALALVAYFEQRIGSIR